MTQFFDRVSTRSLVLTNATDEVVELTLSGNNEKQQRIGRLAFQFKKDYPAEMEIEPGPDCHPIGNIVNQIMQWGPTTPDGKGRSRLTSTIVSDSAGGLAAIIDSTTNDGTGTVMPLVVNVGEAKGTYLVFFADGRIKLRQGTLEYASTLNKIAKMVARKE